MSDPLIGLRLGQYLISELIAQGGMSKVYKAHQETLDRVVAIKVLRYAGDRMFAARFKREARAMAALQHPNILPIYDYGEQGDLLFLVLQYIENGASLRDLVGTPMPPKAALQLVSHVCDALDYAHKRGIIHRDVKPGNILLPSPDWPMLADFGIAKLMNDNQARLTLANQVIGTAAYTAPEQASGQPIDARTDLYAAGVVLYELVTGRVPFDENTPMAMLAKHVYEPPPPARTLNPDLSPAIELVLQKALAKDPNQRYATAAVMAEDLRAAANQRDPDARHSQVMRLYEVGLQAFEHGHWDEAVDWLGQLVALDPAYEDARELLAAARESQERARAEARQRIESIRQQRMGTTQQRPRSAMEADRAAPPLSESGPVAGADATRPVTPAGTGSSERTSVMRTTQLPEVEAPAMAEAGASAGQRRGAAGSPTAAAAPETSTVPSRRRTIAWIVAAVVIFALALALVFILPGNSGSGTIDSSPTGGVPTSAPARTPDSGAIAVDTTGLPSPTAEPAPAPTTGAATAPPPAGKIVFQDDFNRQETLVQSGLEDNVNAPDFQRGLHPPGIYHIRLLSKNDTRVEFLPRALYQNFSVQVDLTDNSDDAIGSVSQGVVFRARDSQHLYALLIDQRTGKYSLLRRNGPDQRADLIPWTGSPLIQPGKKPNRLRIDAAGAQLSFYLNGSRLSTFEESTFDQGMIGLIVVNVDADKPHMHFDNLTIWSADTPAPAPSLPAKRQHPAGDMVLIPSGPYIMGGYDHGDTPPNVVQLDTFYIDRAEVTNAAYRQCVKAGRCSAPKTLSSPTHPDYFNDPAYDRYPVMYVTYDQAQDFCASVGKRLPSEAEWEKAASWNTQTLTKTLFAWGNTYAENKMNSAEANNEDALPVGSFPEEINHTVDMAGNLSEWTNSLWKDYPYVASDGREDAGPGQRVFRGGSWAQTAGKAKVFERFPTAPDYSSREIGFRCAANP